MRTVFTITNRSYRSSSSWPLLWAVRLLNAFKKNAMHYWRHKIPQEFRMVAPLHTAYSPSFVPFPTRARNKAHQRLLYSLAQRMDLLIIGCELRVYTAPFSQISCLEHTKLFPHRGFYAAEVVPTRSSWPPKYVGKVRGTYRRTTERIWIFPGWFLPVFGEFWEKLKLCVYFCLNGSPWPLFVLARLFHWRDRCWGISYGEGGLWAFSWKGK